MGAGINIPAAQLPEAESGSYYDFDLTGCDVYEGTRYLGRVVEVLTYGPTALLNVDRDGKETLIPFARRFMKRIDTAGRRIDVELPEGLLDPEG